MKDYLQKANEAREKGRFKQSLKHLNKAVKQFRKEENFPKLIESHASQMLSLKHLFLKTKKKSFLISAERIGLRTIEAAQEANQKDTLALPFFQLAQIQEELGRTKKALHHYREAILHLKKHPHSSAVLANFQIHLYALEYKNGSLLALRRLKNAIAHLKKAKASKYQKSVWLSGAYLKMAEMMQKEKPERAKEYLQLAEEIIEGDKKLKIRRKQWQKLKKTF